MFGSHILYSWESSIELITRLMYNSISVVRELRDCNSELRLKIFITKINTFFLISQSI